MKKIGYDNAQERIKEMLASYNIITDENGYKYFEMTEKEFNTILNEIIENSTKAFAEKIRYYSVVCMNGTAARISTYKHDFAYIKIIEEPAEETTVENTETTLKIKDLSSILYSNRGNVQFAVVYDSSKNADVVSGCTVEYVIKEYGNCILKHIQAFENQLIFTI